MKKKIFFTVWPVGGWVGGVKKIQLNQNCGKFHEMDKSMKKKKFFFALFGWWVGGWVGGGVKIHLNQYCRKLHEMDKSIKKKKKIFTVWPVGGWVGGGGKKPT